jgi:hypothetical protein
MKIRNKTKYIIIHHSVSPRNTTVEQITAWHKARGFETIGYHYLINEKGIQKGRDEKYIGQHCSANSRNLDSIGICMAGNYQIEYPSTQMLNWLKELLADIIKRYDTLTAEDIFGHRDFGLTACPGNTLYDKIPSIIYDLTNNKIHMDITYEELLKRLLADLKKEFVEKDARFNFDNGATEICSNFKKYKYGTKSDDDKILANKFCKENISDAEKKFKRTTSREDVL